MRLVLLALIFLCSFTYGEIEEYILKPGDVISIQVVEHPEFSGRHKIRPDGRINYPVIGELDVASLTCAQLVKIMEGKLASYVNNPVVSVSIEAYYANKVFVIGDVAKSGEYQIYEPIEVIKALAMCGGLRNQKVKIIKIVRADGSVVDVRVKDLFSSGAKDKFVLYPGDTLYIPDGFQIPWSLISSVLGVISITLSIILNINSLSKN
ncbi:MAG: polysaccharide biosynthesis/export family protein [Chitinivibrionales bacterium]|nr:polysaccharide biosynthesis/export family protein [Chitinivibrionales bacterium]